jgi:hypothetical protein
MTTSNYSIMDVRDLLQHVKNTVIFMNSGVPGDLLPDSTVQNILLSFVETGLNDAESMLRAISSRE